MNFPNSLFRLAVVLAALAVTPATRAIIAPSNPFATITVETEGETTQIPVELIGTDKGWRWSIDIRTEEYEITGEGFLDPDPSIAYGVAVVDFGAPSVFGFLFGTPIVPTGPGTVVSASIVGGLTDFTGDGVSITPTGATLQSSFASLPNTDLGVDVGPAFASGPADPGSFYAYGPDAVGPMAGPVGVFTFLSVQTGFGLSGEGDVAALTGFTSIETAAIPDAGPGILGLLTIGALVLAGRFRRTQAN